MACERPDPLPTWVWLSVAVGLWCVGLLAVGLWCVGLGSTSVGLWPWVIDVWVLGLPAWSVAMGLRRGSMTMGLRRRSFLVVCLGLFGNLSLFCQNKLGDV
jgi:hypothetical protein